MPFSLVIFSLWILLFRMFSVAVMCFFLGVKLNSFRLLNGKRKSFKASSNLKPVFIGWMHYSKPEEIVYLNSVKIIMNNSHVVHCMPFWITYKTCNNTLDFRETAACLHSVSYTTLFFWHPHAGNPTIETQDSWFSQLLLLWTPHLEFTPTSP